MQYYKLVINSENQQPAVVKISEGYLPLDLLLQHG